MRGGAIACLLTGLLFEGLGAFLWIAVPFRSSEGVVTGLCVLAGMVGVGIGTLLLVIGIILVALAASKRNSAAAAMNALAEAELNKVKRGSGPEG